ncbi:uncharacterized protein LOC123501242 [Portunus trituberculatus]|uniref:uncharacterized protein LOC123501242 n=1 Tax=Portunus trituberculatus TaxID=210409 RepID=UPI001E1D0A50|nr:uncharacterized protein LOC123501242 [Portunus trituberculatus]
MSSSTPLPPPRLVTSKTVFLLPPPCTLELPVQASVEGPGGAGGAGGPDRADGAGERGTGSGGEGGRGGDGSGRQEDRPGLSVCSQAVEEGAAPPPTPPLSAHSSDSGLWTCWSGGGDHHSSPPPSPRPPRPHRQLDTEGLRQLNLVNQSNLADFARKLVEEDAKQQQQQQQQQGGGPASGTFDRSRSARRKKGSAEGGEAREAWRELAGVTPSRRLLQLMRRLQEKVGDTVPSILDHVTFGRSPAPRAGKRSPLKDSSLFNTATPPQHKQQQLAVATACGALVSGGGQVRTFFNTSSLPGLREDLLNNNAGAGQDAPVCLARPGGPRAQWRQLPHPDSADMTQMKENVAVAAPVRQYRNKSRQRPPSPAGERRTPDRVPGSPRDHSRQRHPQLPSGRDRSAGRDTPRQRGPQGHCRDPSHTRQGDAPRIRDPSPVKTPRESLGQPRGRDRTNRSHLRDLPPLAGERPRGGGPRGASQPAVAHTFPRGVEPRYSRPPKQRDKTLPPTPRDASMGRLRPEVLGTLNGNARPAQHATHHNHHNHHHHPATNGFHSPLTTRRGAAPHHPGKGAGRRGRGRGSLCPSSGDSESEVGGGVPRKLSTDSSSSGVSGSSGEAPLDLCLTNNNNNNATTTTTAAAAAAAAATAAMNQRNLAATRSATQGSGAGLGFSPHQHLHTRTPSQSPSPQRRGVGRGGEGPWVQCERQGGSVAVLINRYDNTGDADPLLKPTKKLTSSRMSVLKPRRPQPTPGPAPLPPRHLHQPPPRGWAPR